MTFYPGYRPMMTFDTVSESDQLLEIRRLKLWVKRVSSRVGGYSTRDSNRRVILSVRPGFSGIDLDKRLRINRRIRSKLN